MIIAAPQGPTGHEGMPNPDDLAIGGSPEPRSEHLDVRKDIGYVFPDADRLKELKKLGNAGQVGKVSRGVAHLSLVSEADEPLTPEYSDSTPSVRVFDWNLSEKTKNIGREGIAKSRAALRTGKTRDPEDRSNGRSA
jgi:hypothetical protein